MPVFDQSVSLTATQKIFRLELVALALVVLRLNIVIAQERLPNSKAGRTSRARRGLFRASDSGLRV